MPMEELLEALNKGGDPRDLLIRAGEEVLEYRQYSGRIERLLTALLSNNGLQHLIEEAGAVLENPVFMVDTGFRYIAQSPGALDDDSVYATILREELEHGYILESGVAYIRRERIDQITSTLTTPYYLYNDLLQCGIYVSAVRVHSVEVAHIAMLEKNHPFTEADYRLFLRLVGFASQEVQKNAFYSENKGQLFSYLLRDLLESEHPNEQSVTRRLNILKYELGSSFFMAVILAGEGAASIQGLEVLKAQLHPVLSGHIYAFYENTLVVFFNFKEVNAIPPQIVERLTECAQQNGCGIGLSHCFGAITEVRRYYLQARRSAQLGREQHAGGVFFYQDYVWADMLELCKGSRKLIEFCHPGILRLLEYDRENGSQLLATLYVYLENPFNPQRVASILFIHKNTMFYRLDKIRAILGSALKSGAEMFQFHLSFRVLQYLDLFIPPAPPKEELPQ